jgi:O-antigen ligase
MYMVLSTLTLTLIAKDAVRYRWVPRIGACLAVVLLVLSHSGTGVAVLAALCAVVPLYHALRHRRGLRIPAMIIAVLVGAGAFGIFVYDRAPLVAILGKDPTLTGRTELWSALVGWAQQRPWLGYGYGGFWDPQAMMSGAVATERGLGAAVHGHNGLLDLWLDLGLLGVAIYLAVFVGAVVTALAHSQATRKFIDLWPVSFLSFLLLYNVTEDAILREWGLWTVLVATVGSLRLHRSESELALSFPRHRLGGYAPDASSVPGARVGARQTASLGVRALLWAHGRRPPPRSG